MEVEAAVWLRCGGHGQALAPLSAPALTPPPTLTPYAMVALISMASAMPALASGSILHACEARDRP